jgi:sporulation protein YlmC with PRC-barrel domain
MKPSAIAAVDNAAQRSRGGTNMLKELALSTSLAALLLATPTWSQTSTYQTTQPTQAQTTQTQQNATLQPNEARSLVDKPVYGSDGKKIGEINNVLIGKDGRARAAVIDFGGFLGVGEKKVAVDWKQLNISGDRIVVGMTKDQAKAAPEFKREQVAEQYGPDVELVQ